jgi:hypothetical protein
MTIDQLSTKELFRILFELDKDISNGNIKARDIVFYNTLNEEKNKRLNNN